MWRQTDLTRTRRHRALIRDRAAIPHELHEARGARCRAALGRFGDVADRPRVQGTAVVNTAAFVPAGAVSCWSLDVIIRDPRSRHDLLGGCRTNP